MVIIVLMTILIPVVAKSRENSRRSRCAANLKQIGLALFMYAQDNNAYFPVVGKGNDLGPLAGFNVMEISSPVYSCPSSSVACTLAVKTSYKYQGSGLKDDNATPFGISMIYDSSGNHPRNKWMNVLFLDAHVEGAEPGRGPQYFVND